MERTFENTCLLVVGGAGFVGSNLVAELLRHNPREIVILDNFLSSEADNVADDPRIRLIVGSAADERTLRLLPDQIDFAWHLACYHGNQSSIHDPIADHENNALTSLRVFERLKDVQGLQAVVYAAAGCAVAEKTYGDAEATTEDAPVSLHHDSPYSISKLIGELYGNFYWAQHGLPFIKARFQNVYGPREILGAGRWRGTVHTVWRNVVPTFVWRSLNALPLTLDAEGRTSRDFIFVEDMARGLVACARRGQAGETYNLASGVETTIQELATEIDGATGNPTPPILRPARDWDRSGRRFGSTEKAKRALGFEAQVNLAEGVARTVAWTRENRDLIERCMARHRRHMPRDA